MAMSRSLRGGVQGGEARYCQKCRAYKPPRAHHCRVCQRCVLRMVSATLSCFPLYLYPPPPRVARAGAVTRDRLNMLQMCLATATTLRCRKCSMPSSHGSAKQQVARHGEPSSSPHLCPLVLSACSRCFLQGCSSRLEHASLPPLKL